jgi:hypothetical protein
MPATTQFAVPYYRTLSGSTLSNALITSTDAVQSITGNWSTITAVPASTYRSRFGCIVAGNVAIDSIGYRDGGWAGEIRGGNNRYIFQYNNIASITSRNFGSIEFGINFTQFGTPGTSVTTIGQVATYANAGAPLNVNILQLDAVSQTSGGFKLRVTVTGTGYSNLVDTLSTVYENNRDWRFKIAWNVLKTDAAPYDCAVLVAAPGDAGYTSVYTPAGFSRTTITLLGDNGLSIQWGICGSSGNANATGRLLPLVYQSGTVYTDVNGNSPLISFPSGSYLPNGAITWNNGTPTVASSNTVYISPLGSDKGTGSATFPLGGSTGCPNLGLMLGYGNGFPGHFMPWVYTSTSTAIDYTVDEVTLWRNWMAGTYTFQGPLFVFDNTTGPVQCDYALGYNNSGCMWTATNTSAEAYNFWQPLSSNAWSTPGGSFPFSVSNIYTQPYNSTYSGYGSVYSSAATVQENGIYMKHPGSLVISRTSTVNCTINSSGLLTAGSGTPFYSQDVSFGNCWVYILSGGGLTPGLYIAGAIKNSLSTGNSTCTLSANSGNAGSLPTSTVTGVVVADQVTAALGYLSRYPGSYWLDTYTAASPVYVSPSNSTSPVTSGYAYRAGVIQQSALNVGNLSDEGSSCGLYPGQINSTSIRYGLISGGGMGCATPMSNGPVGCYSGTGKGFGWQLDAYCDMYGGSKHSAHGSVGDISNAQFTVYKCKSGRMTPYCFNTAGAINRTILYNVGGSNVAVGNKWLEIGDNTFYPMIDAMVGTPAHDDDYVVTFYDGHTSGSGSGTYDTNVYTSATLINLRGNAEINFGYNVKSTTLINVVATNFQLGATSGSLASRCWALGSSTNCGVIIGTSTFVSDSIMTFTYVPNPPLANKGVCTYLRNTFDPTGTVANNQFSYMIDISSTQSTNIIGNVFKTIAPSTGQGYIVPFLLPTANPSTVLGTVTNNVWEGSPVASSQRVAISNSLPVTLSTWRTYKGGTVDPLRPDVSVGASTHTTPGSDSGSTVGVSATTAYVPTAASYARFALSTSQAIDYTGTFFNTRNTAGAIQYGSDGLPATTSGSGKRTTGARMGSGQLFTTFSGTISGSASTVATYPLYGKFAVLAIGLSTAAASATSGVTVDVQVSGDSGWQNLVASGDWAASTNLAVLNSINNPSALGAAASAVGRIDVSGYQAARVNVAGSGSVVVTASGVA